MYKEIIISLVIIFVIFSLDSVTQKYTDKAISDTTDDLKNIREQIKQKSINYEEIFKKTNESYDKWMHSHEKMAFYIEHNELEKVESAFVTAKSYIETMQYENAISELDKTIFVLKYIHDKYSINWENIF